jgi:hypothetical protein
MLSTSILITTLRKSVKNGILTRTISYSAWIAREPKYGEMTFTIPTRRQGFKKPTLIKGFLAYSMITSIPWILNICRKAD